MLRLAAFLLLPALTFAALACDYDDDDDGAGVTIDDINDDPDAYIGDDVTLTGEVENIIGERGFSFAQNLLVVTQGDENDSTLGEGSRVEVEGTVRSFDLQEIEEEIDFDLPDEPYGEYDGRAVIVADSFEVQRDEGEFPDPSSADDEQFME